MLCCGFFYRYGLLYVSCCVLCDVCCVFVRSVFVCCVVCCVVFSFSLGRVVYCEFFFLFFWRKEGNKIKQIGGRIAFLCCFRVSFSFVFFFGLFLVVACCLVFIVSSFFCCCLGRSFWFCCVFLVLALVSVCL